MVFRFRSGPPSGSPLAGRTLWAEPVAAVLGCLQPAIDPVFLALASSANGISAADHGWVVGVTQGAAAAGAVIQWWLGGGGQGRRALSWLPWFWPLLALAAALATPWAYGLPGLLALRATYGLGMGAIYAQAMGSYAHRLQDLAATAYGVVMLGQLLLATLVSPLLPWMAQNWGSRLALSALALVPALALVALRFSPNAQGAGRIGQSGIARCEAVGTPLAGWLLAMATFWFICATMMVWSLSGGLAMEAGLGQAVIGQAVSLGSLAGAATAWGVMGLRKRGEGWLRSGTPLSALGLLCGLAILAPVLLTQPQQAGLFVVSIVLLNIGSTAMIVLGSGLASAASSDPRFRVLVAATHNLGMTMGPALGSCLLWAWPEQGLLLGAGLAIGLAVMALLAVGLGGAVDLAFPDAGQTMRIWRHYAFWRIGRRKWL